MGVPASQISTIEEVENIAPGLYVATADTEAYFPLRALALEGEEAQLVGERWLEDRTAVITVEVDGVAVRTNADGYKKIKAIVGGIKLRAGVTESVDEHGSPVWRVKK